jgi:hypothetical protein
MTTRKAGLAGGWALFLVLAMGAPVAGASNLDQSQTSYADDGAPSPYGTGFLAQTFTVGADGWLDRVSAYVIVVDDIQTIPDWHAANPGSDDRACQQDLAFETYVSSVKPTAPATGTVAPETPSRSGSALPLLFLGLALAAGFVTVRRVAELRG